MEVAPTPLTRTYTAPTHSRLNNSSSSSSVHNLHHQSHTGSSFSSYSHPSRSSQSTQDTAASAHFPQPPSSHTPPANGTVGASNNVINKVAEKGTSLFQYCLTLHNRLRAVPGFDDEIFATELHAEEDEGLTEPLDPVTLLWRTFRRGYPLMAIYNTLDPDVRLSIDEKMKDDRRSKAAAFKFLQACVHVLKFPTQECFILSDLYSEDTSGFIKVARVVSRVVDKLVENGKIESLSGLNHPQGSPSLEKRTQRQHIVDELVRTERTYVQHLEVLYSFKKYVELRGVIPGDAIHDIFLNLNAMLDFQRRFLIRVEQVNAMPEDQQDWGKEVHRFADAFRVYEQYIANQKNCEETAMREYEKLRDVGGGSIEMQQLVESPTHLTAFLLKPFQRLAKYPLLLKELRDRGDLDEERRNSISVAIEDITSILERTNTYIAQQERVEAVQTLKAQVEDWKEHRIESFGELLLHGVFTVFKNDSNKSEREYRMYLFEKILLCCKDITDKPKGKMMNKPPNNAQPKGKPRMAMKGRIFMQNVTETTFLSKPGHYTCQISWRGEGSIIGNFVVKFPTEDTLKQWRDLIERQRKVCTEQAHRHFIRSASQTDINYMHQSQGYLENAPREEDIDEDEDEDAAAYGYEEQGQVLNSRHGSSTSLRSRSTTGESINPMAPVQARGQAMKHPAGFSAPLTLRTQQLQNSGPGPASYFSPVAESPISSRTSSSSGITPFPRQATPQNGWHADESNRFTAPAHMTRAIGKDGQNVYYQTDPRTGRPVQGQPVPMHHASLSQTRLRSASSPDVNFQNGTGRPVPPNAPPVPSVPSHISGQQGNVNRSQNNSPLYASGVAPRGAGPQPYPGQNRDGTEHIPSAHDSQEYEDGSKSNRGQAGSSQWNSGTISPTPQPGFSAMDDTQGPTNFKVKVEVPSEGSTMTLVAGYNISFQSLKDRIDAKLQRSTNLSLATGSVRLQYLYDGEMVNIQTDEDIQTAFETWRDSQKERQSVGPNQYPEIRLFCTR